MGRVMPTCLALVLCKSVHRSSRNREPVIVRAFEFFAASSFPAPSGPFTVWMQLRDGNGETAMGLAVEHVPSGALETEEIVTIRFSLNFASPNLVLEHEAVFDAGLPLAREGRYRLRLTAHGVTLMQRYFGVFRTDV